MLYTCRFQIIVCDLITLTIFGEECNFRSWNIAVSIVTRLRAGRPGFEPWQDRKLLHHNVQSGAVAHAALYPICTGFPYLRVRRPESEYNHLTPTNAEVKNA
jgi:hypothetical protein